MFTLKVHWLRHGEVASHRGDVPLTEEGLVQARTRGRALAGDLSPGETVHFMHAPTLRTRQTAEEIRASVAEASAPETGVDLREVREQWAIRNPDLFVAGQRVEMVSSAEALSEQLRTPPVAPKALRGHPFFREFWATPDRIGLWVGHPDPPGEDSCAVARRQLAFAASLAEIENAGPVRYVLVTHSPILRAILSAVLGEDPGEPRYGEPVSLAFSDAAAPELGFRDRRESMHDTHAGSIAPFLAAVRTRA